MPPVPGARRPLAGFCLSALAGWLTGFGFHIPVLPVLAICAVLIAFVLLRARSGLASIAVHACALLAAAVHASMTVLPPSAAHLSEQLDRPREFVEVVGTVAGEPIRMDRPGSAEGPWVFALELEGLRRTDPWQRCDGRVEVRWNAPSNAVPPEYGQRRHLAGVVAPRTSRFEAEPFLLQTRGHAELLGVGPHSVFFAWCLEQRKRASAALGRGLPEAEFGPELAMMRALILGERTELDDRVRRAFARTGTLHVVAISGSHVSVLQKQLC